MNTTPYQKNKLLALFVCCSLIVTGFQSVLSQETTPPERTSDILIGVEYFAGWWPESTSAKTGQDWRLSNPERKPVLGLYNGQETMDHEITAAADHGVDFFSILWYYDGNVKQTGDNSNDMCRELNSSVGYFMNSPNANRMKFMVEITNHAPFAILTEEDWDRCTDFCINAMRHPSYLRIDGRAVVKIHGGNQFYHDLNMDVEQCRRILQRMRQHAKDAGVGDLLIAVGTFGGETIGEDHPFVKIGEIDSTMQYMDSPRYKESEDDYPYDDLVEYAREMRNIHKNDTLRWTPYLPVGWNPRPWKDVCTAYKFPTEAQWRATLVELKETLEHSDKFGFPRRDGSVQKAFTIYAWNEYGEGGFLAPTEKSGYMKIDVLKEVFDR